MKIKSLEIENIGKIIKEKIIFDKPLTLFFGEVKQGKTTILNTVKWILGAKFPADILRHGTDKGYGLMKWDNSSIRRTFRRTKDGTIKAGKIEFICDGALEAKPIDAIKQFLNPFLLDQDFFANKSELERNRYFIELFGVDVSRIDGDIKSTDEAAKLLRGIVKAYGEIDTTPVEKPDLYVLKKERTKILDKHTSEKLVLDNENKDISSNNYTFDNNENAIATNNISIKKMKNRIVEIENENETYRKWIKNNPKKDPLPPIPFPDTKKVDEDISDAKATKVKYERYLENKERYDEKQRKNLELSEQETQLRELRADKIKQLSSISDKCGVPGLKFDDNANAEYEGFSLGMISMSQVMRLSSDLSALYPAGFGIELIDRGESLGKSIYQYIEKAKRGEISILATIVGEKPATVPEDVGVWVVEDGKLK